MSVIVRLARFVDSRTAEQRAEWDRQKQSRAAMRLERYECNRAWARHVEGIAQSLTFPTSPSQCRTHHVGNRRDA
jgi:hypothetical protein